MKVVVGLAVIVAVLAITLINGAVMLISPRRWFDLPAWLRAQGTLTPENNLKGWGAFQVRFIGAGMLGIAIWMCYGLWDSLR
jgi:hypothetical protein